MKPITLLAVLTAASAHGGHGRDASDGVPQLDTAGLSSLIRAASSVHSAAFVRFYMNS
jgi:hypothetical protein